MFAKQVSWLPPQVNCRTQHAAENSQRAVSSSIQMLSQLDVVCTPLQYTAHCPSSSSACSSLMTAKPFGLVAARCRILTGKSSDPTIVNLIGLVKIIQSKTEYFGTFHT
jgi:hypothetical protein